MPTLTIPSRSGGSPHEVELDPTSGRPMACTCRAWQMGGVCWAFLETAMHTRDGATRRLAITASKGRRQPTRTARHS